MPKSAMLADFLRSHAHWRLDRAEESDGGRNARSAVALIDAAVYASDLDESAPVVERMAEAGCFGTGHFRPGAEAEQLIRGWRYGSAEEGGDGGPAELLEAVAGAAERALERAAERTAEHDQEPDLDRNRDREQDHGTDHDPGRDRSMPQAGSDPARTLTGARPRTRSKAGSAFRRGSGSRLRRR